MVFNPTTSRRGPHLELIQGQVAILSIRSLEKVIFHMDICEILATQEREKICHLLIQVVKFLIKIIQITKEVKCLFLIIGKIKVNWEKLNMGHLLVEEIIKEHPRVNSKNT